MESPGVTGLPPCEGVALGEVARGEPSLEPLGALRRRAVCERFRAYASPGHSLDTIIAYRAGGSDACFDILLLDEIAACRGVCPDPGEAIGLQLQPYGERIGVVRAS